MSMNRLGTIIAFASLISQTEKREKERKKSRKEKKKEKRERKKENKSKRDLYNDFRMWKNVFFFLFSIECMQSFVMSVIFFPCANI